jgi:hypothetical protein
VSRKALNSRRRRLAQYVVTRNVLFRPQRHNKTQAFLIGVLANDLVLMCSNDRKRTAASIGRLGQQSRIRNRRSPKAVVTRQQRQHSTVEEAGRQRRQLLATEIEFHIRKTFRQRMTDRIRDLIRTLNKCLEVNGWNTAESKDETMDFCYDNKVTRAEAEQLLKKKEIFSAFREALEEIVNDEDDADYDGYRAFKFADERKDNDDWIDYYRNDRELREKDKR